MYENKIYYISAYFSSIFDNHKNIQIENNNFNYIKEYYQSIINNKVNSIIFIDKSNQQFIDKYENELIQIIKCNLNKYNYLLNNIYNIDSIIYKMQPHDIRFFEFYKYIKNNIHIKYIAVTDISDVIIIKNCIDLLKDDNILYVCNENQNIFDNIWFNEYLLYIKKKYNFDLLSYNKFKNNIILNSGIICGHRNIILDLFNKMLIFMINLYLTGDDKIIQRPLDMLAINYVIYTHFNDKLYKPSNNNNILHSPFWQNIYDKSKYFKHK